MADSPVKVALKNRFLQTHWFKLTNPLNQVKKLNYQKQNYLNFRFTFQYCCFANFYFWRGQTLIIIVMKQDYLIILEVVACNLKAYRNFTN